MPLTLEQIRSKGKEQRTQNTPSIPAAPQGDTGLKGVSVGIVKGRLENLQNLGQLVLKPFELGINAIAGQKVVDASKTGVDPRLLERRGTAEKVGNVIGEIAEFALPASRVAKVAKGAQAAVGTASLVSKALGWGARMGIEGLAGAGVSAYQGGSAADIRNTGVITALFPPAGAVLQGASKMVTPFALKTMSFLSGYADDVIQTALRRTPGAVAALKEGEVALTNIVRRTAAGLQDYAAKTLKESKATVQRLTAFSAGGKGYPGTRQAALEAGSQFVTSTARKLRQMFNIGVRETGELLFNRSTMTSNIVSRADQAAIQDAYSLMLGLGKDTSIANIDSVMERMIVLIKKTPVGSPTGAETRKIIETMMSEVVKFTRSLGQFSKAYPEYADFLQKNIPVRAFIGNAKELFGGSKNLSPKEVTQITKRLLQLFNSGNSEIKAAAGEVGEKVGEDLVGGAAGTLVKAGDQISMRAQNLTQRNIVMKLIEWVPRKLLQRYIKSGQLSPQFLQALNRAGIPNNAISRAVVLEAIQGTEDEPQP